MIDNIRTIYDSSHPASFNMAADECLLNELIFGSSPPTLRFYCWEKPTISLGYFQNAEKEIDLLLLKNKGGDIVQRPTGGRAVLHWHDVTFCITMPVKKHKLWDIFRSIHEAICEGLRMAGIPAEIIPTYRNEILQKCREKIPTAACFAFPSKYEIAINGKKVAGTAQKRVRNFILAHGSIAIKSTYRFLFDVLKFPDQWTREKAFEEAMRKMTSIYDETGKEYTYDDLTWYITAGFLKKWNCKFREGTFLPSEIENIKHLQEEKYLKIM